MGARLPKAKREEISRDLVMCHFVSRFLACRSHNALALEFGVCHITIRNIELDRVRWTSLLPEQVKSIKIALAQYNILAPLRYRYNKNGIAKFHGVSHHAVSRVERDFFDRKNKWRTPHVSN